MKLRGRLSRILSISPERSPTAKPASQGAKKGLIVPENDRSHLGD